MKRILVPVDFSPAMEGVLTLAREMARAFDAELHLVHVREISALPVYPAATIGYPGIGMPEMGMTGGMPIALAGEPPNEKRKSRLDHLQDEMLRRGLRAFAHEREGSVVEEILAAAEELSVQLIAMGSHGHGSVYNLLVGSVTEGVLKAARRPILLVPAPAATK
ncbi:MAG TPA: universal stress protein [Chthoniobacterales bacterium]|jgi:nucleotide-binding universal stress UspA family protein